MNYKKISLSTVFVLMLMVPTLLGAVPLTIQTPVGVVSAAVCEAEARNRNTNANRPRALTARNTGANRVERFSANRRTYTVNVRQATNRADIRVGLRAGQQVRWRIDTRRANDRWNNGSYNSWRARTTSNTNQDIRVNINQGQQRRLRVQIRDNSGNIRTITVNVRRASGNTWASGIRHNAGTLTPRFARATTNYTLSVPRNRSSVNIDVDRAHHNAQMRVRMRSQNHAGTWDAWGSWTAYRRADVRFTLTGISDILATQIQFQIRGAFTNMSGTPTRTRNYTVTVRRSAQDMARTLLESGFGFSRTGIIDELVHFGISRADATHAADNVGADWNAQAVIAAQWIVLFEPFITRQELIDHLVVWEGFTNAQATHAANAVGLTGLVAPLSVQMDAVESLELTEVKESREAMRLTIAESIGQQSSESTSVEFRLE